MSHKRTRRHASIALVCLLSSCGLAQAKSHLKQDISLSAGWEFRQRIEGVVANPPPWRPAEVPGLVHTDLLHNKLIPDPFYRDNEAKLQWIENAGWEYRTSFQASPELMKRRNIDITFDGIDSYAEVYLNDKLVTTANNAFRQWRAGVKSALRPGANNLLVFFPSPIAQAKKIASADPWRVKTRTEEKTYVRKPAYEYGWDWGPRFVTSGIWRPVWLEAWDQARIADFHISQRDVHANVTHLRADVEVESAAFAPAKLVVSYTHHGKAYEVAQAVDLHPGLNVFNLPISITNPDLWYPAGYGAQSLYRFDLKVHLGNAIADSLSRRTGLRSVALRREVDQWGRSFAFDINGIPVFAKGADVIPFDSFPTRVTKEDYHRILESARDANMNMIRHWGGGYYESDEFYDLCDELGIMVWQDFMFGNDWQPGTYAFKQGVEEEADYQVRRLRRHPSLVVWCGNNETEEAFNWENRGELPADARLRMWTDYMALFSGILPRVVERLEPEIPYWPSSPSSDYEDISDHYQSGDMHNWNIWHGMEPLRNYEKSFPRFMTEYGFQSFPPLPTIEAFTIQEDRTTITTPVMLSHQKNGAGNQKIHDYMLRDYPEPKDFPSFIYVSEVLQAEAIKIGAEHLRRLRPRSMGSIYWQLNDCWGVASWSSIDYYGRWKALQYYARRFYNDVLVSPHEEDGAVAVYVVSDRTAPLPADLTVTLMNLNGTVLRKESIPIQVAPLSSKVYFKSPREEFLNLSQADPASTFVLTELSSEGKLISSNFLYFLPTKNMHMPAAHVTYELSTAGDFYRLTLSSDVLARDVYISFGDIEATLSDNYFDLAAGRRKEVEVRSKTGLNELKAATKVVSLADSFAPDHAAAAGVAEGNHP